MRDESIYNMKSGLDHKVAILYQQVNFVNMRIAAYESVLSNKWMMFKAIFDPKFVQGKVDEAQMELIKKHDMEVMERMKKAKEEAAKPKIQVVTANGIPKLVALLAILMFPSCVSLNKHNAKVEEAFSNGYKQADRECVELQTKIGAYITQMQERLRRFGQLNEDGSLKTEKRNNGKGWNGDTDRNEVKGTEPWQK